MSWYLVSTRPYKRDVFLKYLENAISKHQLQELILEVIAPQEEVYQDMVLVQLSDLKEARPHLQKIENFQRLEPKPLTAEQIRRMGGKMIDNGLTYIAPSVSSMLKSSIIFSAIASFFALPVLAQSTATVFAPPSNIRNRPNGELVCTVSEKISLNVYQKEGEWYYTDYCGGGYIHQSQIRLQSANTTDRAKVVGLKQGQLALRDAPDGRSLAGLNNGNVVRILEQQDNWAYVQVISGPNARINGLKGWVNSHYLALF